MEHKKGILNVQNLKQKTIISQIESKARFTTYSTLILINQITKPIT